MVANKTVHLISLGCPKNRVDSEVMLGQLTASGYTPVSDAAAADVIVVNTCGFIAAAKEESVDTILEMGAHRQDGRCSKLVVTGCLSQRYAPELAREMPEVDHFLGTGNFDTIAEVLGGRPAATLARRSGLQVLQPGALQSVTSRPVHPRLRGKNALVPFRHAAETIGNRQIVIPDPDFTLDASTPRTATQAAYSRYLKISEGCSNTCAFCIIPKLRGPQRSRRIFDVVAEAEQLVMAGATELVLIAQDLCAYGRDLSPREDLASLLHALADIGERMGRPLWIRCLYAYPKGLTEAVIDAMATRPQILPYLDMPLQHIADGLLRRMRRGCGGAATRALVQRLRRRLPQLTLRTTFITGLPGETEADFAELCDFLAEIRFERVGAFAYSQEEDTPAGSMADQVPAEVAEARRQTLMGMAADISRAQQHALVGQTLSVLVEGVSSESELLLQGRHAGQAPEIDGLTYITAGVASPGDVVEVEVAEAGDFDVAGSIVGATALAG